MRLRVVTVIIRPLSVTVQKQTFYNLFEKNAFPILCLTDNGNLIYGSWMMRNLTNMVLEAGVGVNNEM